MRHSDRAGAPILTALLLSALHLGAAACTPVVGDTCTTDRECGATTGLICDLATVEGYCTKTPCRPGECPPEASCVDFGTGHTYCMYNCVESGDCRDGLVCRSVSACPLPLDPTAAGEVKLGGAVTACSDEGKSFCGVAPR